MAQNTYEIHELAKVEVKNHTGRWIKFRIGGPRGPQATFATAKEAADWLTNRGMVAPYYRVTSKQEG